VWLWFATVGMPEETYTLLARRFARRHAPGRAIAASVARLREHQAEGHRIVVVTGSEERLAREICAALGLADVEVVGSTLVRRRGALAADVHCYGPRKLVRLAEAGHESPFVCAYTDSSTDLPLLLAAVGRFVVEPKPRHLKRILAAAEDCLTLE
jgi:phosphatidylglycerophosphatase C